MILITGTKGFIGKYLCNYFDEKKLKYIPFIGDITKPGNYVKYKNYNIKCIIHLAALIPHKNNWSLEKLNQVNIEGTNILYSFFSKTKIIFVSTKDIEKLPLTDYSQSKSSAEAIIKKNNSNLIIRLPSVYGPNQTQKKLLPKIFEYYYQKKKLTIHNDDIREYIYIKDLCKIIVENLNNNGILSLQGTKIKNLRLKKLIKFIYEKNPVKITDLEEFQIFNNLQIISREYEKDNNL
ncbi:MAG: hypothetical protein K940chlam1_00585 [Candidatus Anoxychlamydiales bacterium]|nr:hypothetical protein [Candidatus Anoxychlamydiales bacterium]NGX35510.1 hypothetical protein [Candidatus Anoxychlamydiales bacterium]